MSEGNGNTKLMCVTNHIMILCILIMCHGPATRLKPQPWRLWVISDKGLSVWLPALVEHDWTDQKSTVFHPSDLQRGLSPPLQRTHNTSVLLTENIAQAWKAGVQRVKGTNLFQPSVSLVLSLSLLSLFAFSSAFWRRLLFGENLRCVWGWGRRCAQCSAAL